MTQLHMAMIQNKQTRRLIELLSHLTNATYPITLQILSKELGVSSRTLLTDLTFLKDIIPTNWQLKGETNKGYTLDYPNAEAVATLKKEILSNEVLFIIINAIYNDIYFSVFEWSEKLFTTEYSLLRNLNTLKKLLKEYHLTLSHSPITLKGNEVDIRYFFFIYFYDAQEIPHIVEPTTKIENFYTKIMSDLATESTLKPIVQFHRTTFWIMIILQRIKNNHFVKFEEILIQDQKNNDFYPEFENIWFKFKHIFDVEFPDDEIVFITLLNINNYYFDWNLLPTTTSALNELPTDNDLDFLLLKLTKEFTLDPNLIQNVLFAYKSYIKNTLHITKLSPLFQKNQQDLNEYVKHEHGYILSICLTFINEHSFFKTTNLLYYPDDLAVNLTLITAAHINQEAYSNKSVLFVLEGNQNFLLYLQVKAQRFASHGVKIHFISSDFITPKTISTLEIDIIIVNYNIFKLNIDIPIIKTSSIPTENDWDRISSLILK